jgi:hypothetical protein
LDLSAVQPLFITLKYNSPDLKHFSGIFSMKEKQKNKGRRCQNIIWISQLKPFKSKIFIQREGRKRGGSKETQKMITINNPRAQKILSHFSCFLGKQEKKIPGQ